MSPPTKPEPKLRNAGAVAVPPRLAEWLTLQLPRAKGVQLCMQTMSAPQLIDSWPRGEEKLPRASELAAEIWGAALEDAATLGPLSGAPRFMIVIVPKDGTSDAPRLGFGIPLQPKSEPGGPTYTPDVAGVTAQTLAHLASRESASQAMLIEGLEGIFTANKVQLEEMQKARRADKDHFESVIESYKALLKAQGEGNEIAMKSANQQIGLLSNAYNAQQAKWLDVLPTVEELYSQRHERELELARQSRSDDRKDKLITDAQKMVFPAIAAKLGLLPMFGGGAPKAPANPSAAPPSSPDQAPRPPPAHGEPSTLQATIFGARTLRAIESFLGALNGDEVAGIEKALRPATKEIFDEVQASLFEDAAEIEKRVRATVNGAASKEAAAS